MYVICGPSAKTPSVPTPSGKPVEGWAAGRCRRRRGGAAASPRRGGAGPRWGPQRRPASWVGTWVVAYPRINGKFKLLTWILTRVKRGVNVVITLMCSLVSSLMRRVLLLPQHSLKRVEGHARPAPARLGSALSLSLSCLLSLTLSLPLPLSGFSLALCRLQVHPDVGGRLKVSIVMPNRTGPQNRATSVWKPKLSRFLSEDPGMSSQRCRAPTDAEGTDRSRQSMPITTRCVRARSHPVYLLGRLVIILIH